MRWSDRGRSGDLEDRRGEGVGGIGGGGGLPFMLLSMVASRFGLGGIVVLLLVMFLFRGNFLSFIGGGSSSAPTSTARPVNDPAEEPKVRFVSFVLDDVQQTWEQIFEQRGRQYPHARLVLFRDAIRSGCGVAQSETGPFYCPADQKAYIDLGFYDELKNRFGADGDFAQAYVLAHEIGHHVQDVLGTERKVRQAMENNPGQKNEYSVRLELQADCYAGVWGHSTEQRDLINQADISGALNAAAAIGDDRIQRMSGREVSPESFTHGSSQQRQMWFKRGLETGSLEACNTFAGSQ
ncbi:MAG TPA: neutral zinc metallopeptidase [Terriglobales bacterium]